MELGLKFVAVIIFSMLEVQVFLVIPLIYGEGRISKGLFLMLVPCFAFIGTVPQKTALWLYPTVMFYLMLISMLVVSELGAFLLF